MQVSSDSPIEPYKMQIVYAYVPLVSTSGSAKIKVYNDYSPDSKPVYIYEAAEAEMIPAEYHVHFVREDL